MNIIIIILIFLSVLFIYLHIFYHLKVSNDLELYKLRMISKERYEEVLNLRQPVVTDLDISNYEKLMKKNIMEYNSFDIKLRDTSSNYISEIYLPISLEKGIKILSEDKESRFLSENNYDFLKETGLIKILKNNDIFLRPPLIMYEHYDYIMGSKNSYTPLRYEMNYRHFIVALSGEIDIKLFPPISNKYLHPILDYDNYEFRSPINPWDIQSEYNKDFSKLKCLDITLSKGKLLFIPGYWWYSYKFKDDNSIGLSFRYRTYMNTVAILPHLVLTFLQRQNITHKIKIN